MWNLKLIHTKTLIRVIVFIVLGYVIVSSNVVSFLKGRDISIDHVDKVDGNSHSRQNDTVVPLVNNTITNVTQTLQKKETMGGSVGMINEDEKGEVFKNIEQLQTSPNSVTNGHIYWNDEVDKLIPKGLSDDAADAWIMATRSTQIKVKSLEAATKDKCGHRLLKYMPNGFAVLTDGSKMCVRIQRSDRHGSVVGDSLSYWLARFLTLDNVPPVTLTYANLTMWSEVKDVMPSLSWKNDILFSLNMWVDGIGNSNVTAKMRMVPQPIVKAWKSGISVTKNTFKDIDLRNLQVNQSKYNSTLTVQSSNMTLQESIVLMAQWSTMIVFDYITGNNDRLRMHFLGRYRGGIEAAVENNLAVFKTSTKLWLIDNELGFVLTDSWKKYEKYHEKMIKTCCIFQRIIVEKLVSLDKEPYPFETFLQFVFQHEPLLQSINKDHWKHIITKERFARRVREVVQWFEQCEEGFEKYVTV